MLLPVTTRQILSGDRIAPCDYRVIQVNLLFTFLMQRKFVGGEI
jgi:hypothetical protein